MLYGRDNCSSEASFSQKPGSFSTLTWRVTSLHNRYYLAGFGGGSPSDSRLLSQRIIVGAPLQILAIFAMKTGVLR
jgi:hypothetical protein